MRALSSALSGACRARRSASSRVTAPALLRASMGAATKAAAAPADEVVLASELGALRVATLNRPAALNALNAPMVHKLDELYTKWAALDHVVAVVLKGAGGKALCSGGDVKAAALAGMGNARDAAAAFFKAEYALDYKIATLRKPSIAIMDGITMGGGAGLAMNSAIRVATDKTIFAMPEAFIGFFADVGATHFLGRLPGRLGTALALTGWRLNGRELYEVRLATHYVPSDLLGEMEGALARLDPVLCTPEAVATTISSFNVGSTLAPLPESSILRHAALVDRVFGGGSAEEIEAALAAAAAGEKGAAGELCGALLAEWRRASPTTLKVVLEALRRQRGKGLREALVQDNRIAHAMLAGKDFYEGVRAALIDKTKDPRWAPAALKDVTPAMVEAHFAPLPPHQELSLPPPPPPQRAARL